MINFLYSALQDVGNTLGRKNIALVEIVNVRRSPLEIYEIYCFVFIREIGGQCEIFGLLSEERGLLIHLVEGDKRTVAAARIGIYEIRWTE